MMGARVDMRFAGFGGQGVITLAKVLGKVAVEKCGWDGAMIEYYGPEIQGGWSRADLALHPSSVGFPVVTDPDLLVCFSQDGWYRNEEFMTAGSVVVHEAELVSPDSASEGMLIVPVPAISIAEEHGVKRAANVVLLGAAYSLMPLLPRDKLLQTILGAIPASKRAENEACFIAGEKCGQEWLDANALTDSPGRLAERMSELSAVGVVE